MIINNNNLLLQTTTTNFTATTTTKQRLTNNNANQYEDVVFNIGGGVPRAKRKVQEGQHYH